ncbi:hypothetical protein KGA66_17210 [Actinocrinis puniceicyclus]|uniref:Uncharacterized protein n=1 Tax=Actinocrinis puniceicyclus TaxID=977794 RepID=A0A8J7WSF7_9ACTN|nr:hypothetical protein [Actinocrinis puniceicyclus]MBS2964800.1 hypothetical protein [Actinocrinis puniceicyclus]
MTTTPLLRAPRDIASWMWFPRHLEPGLQAQYALAARIAEIAARHGLLTAPRIVSAWSLDGVRVPQVCAVVQPTGALDDPAVLAAVVAARPDELPERAVPGEIELEGPGSWYDADGAAHADDGLLRITVDLLPGDPWVQVEVFHDVWMPYDFTGRPHPEVYQCNASRLAAALTDINALLGAEAEPGELTYFGRAVALGVENSFDDDGEPLDVTDLIKAAAQRYGG